MSPFAKLTLVLVACAASARAEAPAPQPMVEWVVPALPTNKPQTPEQAEEGRRSGRKLPPPEVLKPALDPDLPAYRSSRKKLSGTFKGGASDVLTVIATRWFEAFRKYHPEVKLSIAPPYAGSVGAQELVKENLDFVFVSRELKPDDIAGFKAKFGYDPLSVPICGGSYRHFGALDAVVFFVHKDNPLQSLTFEQIDAIYSSTHHLSGKGAARWGDFGLPGEWAELPIRPYGIKPWNGFEEFVRQRALSKGSARGEWREGVSFEKVVFPMAKLVASDRAGIGYSGVAYLDAAVRVLPIAIAAGEAPVAPTYENVALAKYPLSRLVFFNVNKAPGKPLPPALDEFLRFVLSREGQEVVRDHGIYLPLRASQVQGGRVMLAAAPPAGAQGAMSKVAQSLLEKTLVEHPEAAHVVMHVTPPGRPDTDNEIIASNIGKIGKKADDDDLRILRTGQPETVVSKTGDRFSVSLPLFDSGRNTIGVVAIGLPYKPGDDKAALVRTAERIRDELRAQIPSAARFF